MISSDGSALILKSEEILNGIIFSFEKKPKPKNESQVRPKKARKIEKNKGRKKKNDVVILHTVLIIFQEAGVSNIPHS